MLGPTEYAMLAVVALGILVKLLAHGSEYYSTKAKLKSERKNTARRRKHERAEKPRPMGHRR
jgi:hypothetical protein